MQGLFGRAISHTHAAASQLPKRTVFTPRDLKVIENHGSSTRDYWISFVQSCAKQTSKTGALHPQRFAADRTGCSRCWWVRHCLVQLAADAAISPSTPARARAVPHPLLLRYLPSVALRPAAARGS